MPQDPGPFGNYKNWDGSPTSWIPDPTPSISSNSTDDRTWFERMVFSESLSDAERASLYGFVDTLSSSSVSNNYAPPSNDDFKQAWKAVGKILAFGPYFLAWQIIKALNAGVTWGLGKVQPNRPASTIQLQSKWLTGGLVTAAAAAGYMAIINNPNLNYPGNSKEKPVDFSESLSKTPSETGLVFYIVANEGTALRKEASSPESSLGTLKQGSCVVANVGPSVKAQFLQAFAITADRSPLGFVSRAALEPANGMDWLTCRAELN